MNKIRNIYTHMEFVFYRNKILEQTVRQSPTECELLTAMIHFKNFFLRFFFLMWTIFKVFIELVTIVLLF